MKKATLLLMVVLAAFWGCEEEVVDETVTYDSFDIQQVASRATAADANAEIIRMIPTKINTKAPLIMIFEFRSSDENMFLI